MKTHRPGRVLVTALAALALLPLVIVALIPPLPAPELERRSDIIIDGVVSRIDTLGKVYHDNCYGWQKYRATVLVEKIIKGRSLPTAIVVEYETRVINEKRCVGGRDSYTLAKGGRYRMNLTAIKGRPQHYAFFHWMCLQEGKSSGGK